MYVKRHDFMTDGPYLGTTTHDHIRAGLHFYTRHGWNITHMQRMSQMFLVYVTHPGIDTSRTLRFVLARHTA